MEHHPPFSMIGQLLSVVNEQMDQYGAFEGKSFIPAKLLGSIEHELFMSKGYERKIPANEDREAAALGLRTLRKPGDAQYHGMKLRSGHTTLYINAKSSQNMDAVVLAYMGKVESVSGPNKDALAHVSNEFALAALLANGAVSALYVRGRVHFANSWYAPNTNSSFAHYPYPKTHEEIETIMKKILSKAQADPGTASFQVLSDMVMLAVNSYGQFREKHSISI